MNPTIVNSKAGNWVDRGESPLHTMSRVLARFFARMDPALRPWLEEHANIIVGMVAADASEVHVAGYLCSLARDEKITLPEPVTARLTAVALWHIAKSALVRDFAERVLRGEIPVNAPTRDSLSHWVASRLLTEEELVRFEQEGAPLDDSSA